MLVGCRSVWGIVSPTGKVGMKSVEERNGDGARSPEPLRSALTARVRRGRRTRGGKRIIEQDAT